MEQSLFEMPTITQPVSMHLYDRAVAINSILPLPQYIACHW